MLMLFLRNIVFYLFVAVSFVKLATLSSCFGPGFDIPVKDFLP